MSSRAELAEKEPLLNKSSKDVPKTLTLPNNKKMEDGKTKSQTSVRKESETSQANVRKNSEKKDTDKMDNTQSKKSSSTNTTRKTGSKTKASVLASPALTTKSVAKGTKSLPAAPISSATKTEKKVQLVGTSHDGANPQCKGPKRDDPNIYKWTWKYVLAMIFYLLTLYFILALFTTIIMTPIVWIASHGPAFFGYGHFVGVVPKIYVVPHPGLINAKAKIEVNYDCGVKKSYEKFLSLLSDFVEKYKTPVDNSTWSECTMDRKNQTYGRFTDETCPAVTNTNSTEPLFDLGTCGAPMGFDKQFFTLSQYGYQSGEPCFAISFTKILGMYPNNLEDFHYKKILNISTDKVNEKLEIEEKINELCNYTGNMDLGNTRKNSNTGNMNLTQCCEEYRFAVICKQGHNSNLTFEYFPKAGASLCPLPFWGQKGYQQPFVMVKVKGLLNGKKAKITCQTVAHSWHTLPSGNKNKVELEFKIRGATAANVAKDLSDSN